MSKYATPIILLISSIVSFTLSLWEQTYFLTNYFAALTGSLLTGAVITFVLALLGHRKTKEENYGKNQF